MSTKTLRYLALLTVATVAQTALAQRYQPVQENGVWWLKGPNGEKVFARGVCVVEPGTKWDEYDLNNPSYGAFKFYPTKSDWAKDAIRRLEAGAFNTVGAWSAYSDLLAVPGNKLYMTPIMHMGSSAGFPWVDMWDPGNVKVCDDVAKGLIQSLKQDKRIIGYFSDNELGWWKGAMFDWVWRAKTHYGRRRVVDLLLKHYHGSWERLTREFDPDGAASFDELRQQGRLLLKPSPNGEPAVIKDVFRLLAARYYSLCRSIIKKYDPEALFLGDRYISNYYPEIAEEAGKYCDVVSTNLNPDWSDGGYVRFHLQALAALTRKPLMITEYYMCSKAGRSGNGNDRSGFPVVDTLEQRAQGFTKTTSDLASDPNVVGAHWFQYYDEPQNGRGDGENYNFGLVDVYNKPYTELLQASKNLDVQALHTLSAGQPIADSLPMTPTDSEDLTKWKREQAYVAPNEKVARGDLYGSWGPEGLTLGLYWMEDRMAEIFYRDNKFPDSSRTTIEIAVPGSKTRWLLRVNEKEGTILAGPNWKYSATWSPKSRLIVHIPAATFGSDTLAVGQRIQLNVRLISETRAYTTTWDLSRPLGK